MKNTDDKVVHIRSRKRTKKTPEKRTCSATAVTEDGRRLYGVAAHLYNTKRMGGIDSSYQQVAEKVLFYYSFCY